MITVTMPLGSQRHWDLGSEGTLIDLDGTRVEVILLGIRRVRWKGMHAARVLGVPGVWFGWHIGVRYEFVQVGDPIPRGWPHGWLN